MNTNVLQSAIASALATIPVAPVVETGITPWGFYAYADVSGVTVAVRRETYEEENFGYPVIKLDMYYKNPLDGQEYAIEEDFEGLTGNTKYKKAKRFLKKTFADKYFGKVFPFFTDTDKQIVDALVYAVTFTDVE